MHLKTIKEINSSIEQSTVLNTPRNGDLTIARKQTKLMIDSLQGKKQKSAHKQPSEQEIEEGLEVKRKQLSSKIQVVPSPQSSNQPLKNQSSSKTEKLMEFRKSANNIVNTNSPGQQRSSKVITESPIMNQPSKKFTSTVANKFQTKQPSNQNPAAQTKPATQMETMPKRYFMPATSSNKARRGSILTVKLKNKVEKEGPESSKHQKQDSKRFQKYSDFLKKDEKRQYDMLKEE